MVNFHFESKNIYSNTIAYVGALSEIGYKVRPTHTLVGWTGFSVNDSDSSEAVHGGGMEQERLGQIEGWGNKERD